MKKTLVLGASENPERYSYKAAKMLKLHGHDIILLGIKEGRVDGEKILTGRPVLENIDTVTVYLSVKNQAEYYEYIKELKPSRVIFNPGAENMEFENILLEEGIEPLEACTLVLLSIGKY